MENKIKQYIGESVRKTSDKIWNNTKLTHDEIDTILKRTIKGLIDVIVEECENMKYRTEKGEYESTATNIEKMARNHLISDITTKLKTIIK